MRSLLLCCNDGCIYVSFEHGTVDARNAVLGSIIKQLRLGHAAQVISGRLIQQFPYSPATVYTAMASMYSAKSFTPMIT